MASVNEPREIQPGDIVEFMFETPEIYEISRISRVDENDVDVRIYLNSYLIKSGKIMPIIEHNNILNRWVVPHLDPDIQIKFHGKPDFPESGEALEYLRKFVHEKIFGLGANISRDPMVYGDSDDPDSMIDSATRYWQKLLFDPMINKYTTALRDNNIVQLPVMYRDMNNKLIIIPEYIDPFIKIYTYLNGDLYGNPTNEDGLKLAKEIHNTREEYMKRISPMVKAHRKR